MAELKVADRSRTYDNETIESSFNIESDHDLICCKRCLLHKCWTNTRCCCCFKCCESSQTQFTIYNTMNIIRFVIIAVLIYISNEDNISETKPFWRDCCNCYQILKDPNAYSPHRNIPNDVRFDLSVCIPSCVNCTYCDGHSEYISVSCPASDYTELSWPYSVFSWNWYSKTGCNAYESRISLTMRIPWIIKSYTGYGILSAIIIGIYVVILFVFVCLVLCKWCKFNGSEKEFSRVILIYNVMIAEMSLYFVFKPYQYYNEQFIMDEKTIKCLISSTPPYVRSWIIIMIIGLSGFVLIHIVMECLSCSDCCTQKSKHVTVEENTRLLAAADYQIQNSSHFNWIRIRIWFGVLFSIWILIFFIVLIIAYIELLLSYHEHYEQDKWHIEIIYSTALLSVLALFDGLFVSSSREWLKQYCLYTQMECYRTCCKQYIKTKQELNSGRTL